MTGEGAGELPDDEEHLVVRAMRAAFDVLGGRPAGLAVECVNRIPQARGLGSSSAAIVAGVLLARALVVDGDAAGSTTRARCGSPAGIEGHPDNVAPCLLGGFTIAWTEAGRRPGGVAAGRRARTAHGFRSGGTRTDRDRAGGAAGRPCRTATPRSTPAGRRCWCTR